MEGIFQPSVTAPGEDEAPHAGDEFIEFVMIINDPGVCYADILITAVVDDEAAGPAGNFDLFKVPLRRAVDLLREDERAVIRGRNTAKDEIIVHAAAPIETTWSRT